MASAGSSTTCVRRWEDRPMMREPDAGRSSWGSPAGCASARSTRGGGGARVPRVGRWRDHSFIFLGYRGYDLASEAGELVLRAVDGSGLGVLGRLHRSSIVSTSFARLPAQVRAVARAPSSLVLTKANSRSTVHRPAYLDYIGVKRFDASGKVCGERRFVGLYTSSAETSTRVRCRSCATRSSA